MRPVLSLLYLVYPTRDKDVHAVHVTIQWWEEHVRYGSGFFPTVSAVSAAAAAFVAF